MLRLRLLPLSTVNKVLRIQTRHAGAWNKDWQPGPYPKTLNERAAAAKKYGLRLEEYEPYPDDGTGFGDYPKLPIIPADARDPHKYYDYPAYRRNFMEPIHADADLYGFDRLNPNRKFPVSPGMQIFTFASVMFTIFALFFLGEYKDIRFKWPVMEKQFPNDCKVHYSFELDD